ncbi:MAG: hypothetical protein HKN92_04710 [Chitinophagales bacterium]|nr:hypothetical protein [Chitinophagales bacterium]
MLQRLANLISIVFLPPFFPTIGLIYLMLINPYRYNFAEYDNRKTLLVIIVFIMTAIFPIITILIMKAQKLVKSISLMDRKDRTIPYITTGCFYLWAMMIFIKGRDDIYGADETLIYLLAGATTATFISFIINIYFKISIHAMAAGSIVGLIIFSAGYSIYNIIPFLTAAIMIAGLIGMSRLILTAHEQEEVYWGYAVGIIGQLIGFQLFPRIIPYIS